MPKSKKKAFTLRLDEDIVDAVDDLGDTRTGKVQELIKIGLAHYKENESLSNEVKKLNKRIDNLQEEKSELIKYHNKLVDLYRKLRDSNKNVEKKVDHIYNYITGVNADVTCQTRDCIERLEEKVNSIVNPDGTVKTKSFFK